MRTRTFTNLDMSRRRFLAGSTAALAALGLQGCASAPEERSQPAFPGLRDRMAGQVTRSAFPGAVWLVAQGDDVEVDMVGVSAIGGTTPMRRDTIFRIASMTKPLTATAVMMLVEEGTLTLDAPAEKWLPELADRQVLKQTDGPLDDTVPANRAITVRDLLTFTLGFGIMFDESPPS